MIEMRWVWPRVWDATAEALGDLSTAWEEGDVYLRLSAVGLCLLAILGALICVSWMRFGRDISAVIESKREPKCRDSVSKC